MTQEQAIIREFLPDDPVISKDELRTRGDPYVMPFSSVKGVFDRQNGYCYTEWPDTHYAIPDKDWILFSALEKFRAFKEHIHGLPFEKIYELNLYDCNRFAISFYDFLSDCQRLYWKEKLPAVLAVGWGYTFHTGTTPVPRRHAISLAALRHKGKLRICAIESQDSGFNAMYGEITKRLLRFAHF